MFKTESGREIHFYGEEFENTMKPIDHSCDIHDLDMLFKVLLRAWEKQTAYPRCQHDYIHDNDPTYGQCAITASIVFDLLGGTSIKLMLMEAEHIISIRSMGTILI